MKISEYIKSGTTILNSNNIFTLQKYEYIISHFTSKFKNKYLFIPYEPQFLHNNDMVNVLSGINNKVILLSNLDVDFPPPKKPYEYDAYFDPAVLPENYLEIPYGQKIQTEVLPILLENNIKIFAHAVSINHPNVTMIPGGVFSKFNHFHLKTNNKNNLCYANFGLNCDRWFGNPRNEILEWIKNKDFVLKENIISTEIVRRNTMNDTYYYHKIAQSKFAICPRGCSLDTYRLWDCICLGCIPIVEKYGGYEQFEDLPILFIESYKDYGLLTEEYLNKAYGTMMQKEYNYSKLTFQYWLEKIQKYMEQ